MNILEFFDPTKKEHLQAYKQLCTKGTWPIGFVPAHITVFPTWQVSVANKIAQLFLAEKLDNEKENKCDNQQKKT